MTETAAVYAMGRDPVGDEAIPTDGPAGARRLTPVESADMITLYFRRRRDVLIMELREIDRLLGLPQTVPVRER